MRLQGLYISIFEAESLTHPLTFAQALGSYVESLIHPLTHPNETCQSPDSLVFGAMPGLALVSIRHRTSLGTCPMDIAVIIASYGLDPAKGRKHV